ncbi:keratin-associated protein 19-3-like [Equus przewalskii]|uniref:Keratin-associated protein 19-3-like n=1 Tax=Equus przewalskii TaxID=9798 RepID=A0ABM4MKV7_EQUPR
MSYYYGNYYGGLGCGLGGFSGLGYGYGSGYGLGGYGGYGLRKCKSPGAAGDVHPQGTHLRHPTKPSRLNTMTYYYGNYYGGLGYGLGGFSGQDYGYGSSCSLGGYSGCGFGYYCPTFYRRYWSSGFF